MATPRPFFLSFLLAALAVMLPPFLRAEHAGLGISRALAAQRAQRISNLRYDLSFTVAEHSDAVQGSANIDFDSRSTGDLLLDYRDGTLQSATLNNQSISPLLDNGHLHLPATAGHNVLRLTFVSHAAPAGKAFTRYDDRDDASEYIYTLFVPMDASMAFPCFDQPDLKAVFTLAVEHPAGWTVIGNAAPHVLDATHTRFDPTKRISTYLFAFAAGPFAAIPAHNGSAPAIYVRKSQLRRALEEAPQVQSMAQRGIAYFSAFFAQPFPFPKYDLVLIPGFPFGGMEHAGATFLNEDGVLFRSTPTPSDYFRRNTLVLHETCHQWFGDMVTMQWFDDLWLKEGFAQYMAYKALAQLEPASQAWNHFYQDIKPPAYGIDETLGTTPIYQDIPNLKDAKSAYGAIVYEKAPAVLKQLEFRIGPDNFRDGLRLYLKQHAYGNAQWNDLISAFEQAGRGSAQNNTKDLHAWAQAWIQHRGMPQVDARWSCIHGKLAHLVLTQHDVLPDGFLWPISNQVELHWPGASHTFRVDWNTSSTAVKDAIGQACPAYIYTNAGDEAYGRFLLDPKSEQTVAKTIGNTSNHKDPLLRDMLWGALWDNVRLALSPPQPFLARALAALPEETDESMARVQYSRIATVLHSYVPARVRTAEVPAVESLLEDRMLHAPSPALRIVSFRAFSAVAETPQALGEIKSLLNGTATVPGMPLKRLDRWNLIGHLIAMNDPEADTIYQAEKARDTSGEAQKYAYAVYAGTFDAAVKTRYFQQYLHDTAIQEDWITQSLRPFNSWNQASVTQPYLAPALDNLEQIKQHRKIFFLGAWLAAFLDGQNTLANCNAAQAQVHAWLAANPIDPDLRRKVLQSVDALERTNRIRLRYWPHEAR